MLKNLFVIMISYFMSFYAVAQGGEVFKGVYLQEKALKSVMSQGYKDSSVHTQPDVKAALKVANKQQKDSYVKSHLLKQMYVVKMKPKVFFPGWTVLGYYTVTESGEIGEYIKNHKLLYYIGNAVKSSIHTLQDFCSADGSSAITREPGARFPSPILERCREIDRSLENN